MARSSGGGSGGIDELLSQRSQYEQWLSKLAASAAPDAVRDKVRADYEGRLAQVMESLRHHADAIAAELDKHRSALADLERRERAALETTAEAELRHAVGEFDAGKWEEISRSQKATLDGIRGELKRVRGEIDRLSEVQSSIASRGEEAEEPAEEAEEPAAPAAAAPGRDLPGDELDFLKSVAVEQSASLSPQAAAESKKAGAAPAQTSAPVPPAPPAAEPPPAAAAPRPSGATPQAKTLKCGECGTLNRPTEWYCERCGAELAAL